MRRDRPAAEHSSNRRGRPLTFRSWPALDLYPLAVRLSARISGIMPAGGPERLGWSSVDHVGAFDFGHGCVDDGPVGPA